MATFCNYVSQPSVEKNWQVPMVDFRKIDRDFRKNESVSHEAFSSGVSDKPPSISCVYNVCECVYIYTYCPGKASFSIREQYANAYAERRLRQNRFSSIRPKVKPFLCTSFSSIAVPLLSDKNYFVLLLHTRRIINYYRHYSPYNPIIVSLGRIKIEIFRSQIIKIKKVQNGPSPSSLTMNVHLKNRDGDFCVLC